MSGVLSVVFTDLVGFTTYTDQRGDDAAVLVLDAARRIVDGSIEGTDGRVVKELGDGIMLAFGDASASLRSVAVLADALRRGFSGGDLPLAARVGLHRGDVVQRGDDLVGHTVNIAARVTDLAGPGELLVSDEVLAACGDDVGVRTEAVGPVRVRGVRAPIWLHRVLAR